MGKKGLKKSTCMSNGVISFSTIMAMSFPSRYARLMAVRCDSKYGVIEYRHNETEK